MPPIYLISLDRDTVRREKIRRQFPITSPNFITIRAVDALHLPQSVPPPVNLYDRLTKGEIACALSHVKAYESLISSGERLGIVFEDDVEGCEEDLKTAQSIATNFSDNGLILLGGLQGLRNTKYIFGKPTKIKNLLKIHPACKRFIARACCYILTKEMAASIVRKQLSGIDRADHWYRLLDNYDDVYYADIFTHPVSVGISNIEFERNKMRGNFIARIRKDGIFYTLNSQIIKFWFIIFYKFFKLQKIPIKNYNL